MERAPSCRPRPRDERGFENEEEDEDEHEWSAKTTTTIVAPIAVTLDKMRYYVRFAPYPLGVRLFASASISAGCSGCMTETKTIDLGHVARDLNLPADKVQRTVELLDEGNTVPFITRYRKDLTGGLDEEQIRDIQSRIARIRQLAERKATILKSIESQGKLTPELAEQIRHANTPKRLEDLYLPFKPKKQTLATIARERGLEPLAVEIFEAQENAADLQARAVTFTSADRELHTIEDVLSGVGHLIAERIGENAELRGRLRRIFQRSGKIVCTKVERRLWPRRRTSRLWRLSRKRRRPRSRTGRVGERERGRSRQLAKLPSRQRPQ